TRHQFYAWSSYLQAFGLPGGSRELPAPIQPERTFQKGRIGLIPGSENFPPKRWPVSHWAAMVEKVEKISPTEWVCFGTPREVEIGHDLENALGSLPASWSNRIGKTSLTELVDELSTCALVICNDTGGMHLASLLG